jgi:hypothetical protein
MSDYVSIVKKFKPYIEEYIQKNGAQTPLQVKQLAKDYAIQSRNGVYDLTARKRYCTLFMNYCLGNNIEIPFEGLPAGWGHIGDAGMNICFHDPDSEFTDDERVQKLIKAADKRFLKKMEEHLRHVITTHE